MHHITPHKKVQEPLSSQDWVSSTCSPLFQVKIGSHQPALPSSKVFCSRIFAAKAILTSCTRNPCLCNVESSTSTFTKPRLGFLHLNHLCQVNQRPPPSGSTSSESSWPPWTRQFFPCTIQIPITRPNPFRSKPCSKTSTKSNKRPPARSPARSRQDFCPRIQSAQFCSNLPGSSVN